VTAAGILGLMPRDTPPQEIVDLADARAAARRAFDWETADRLKEEIESAGWRVIDAASLYTLERAAPPDIDEGSRTRYGSSASVPSRLEESPTGVATAVLLAEDDPADLARTIHGLVEHAPDGMQLVIVANAPGEAQAAALADLDALEPGSPGVATEVVWTSVRLGAAAAWNAGIRRALAPVVVLVAPGTEPRSDIVGAIVAALENDSVGVAGPVGLVTDDLRRYEESDDDATDAHAIAGAAIGFRRADYVARGPLDEHFVVADSLDAWWSLVLRDPWLDDDENEDGEAEDPADVVVDLSALPRPRRAVRVQAEILRHQLAADVPHDERLAKKNRYRLLKYYATRRDLLAR
jgi:hypothetical protein